MYNFFFFIFYAYNIHILPLPHPVRAFERFCNTLEQLSAIGNIISHHSVHSTGRQPPPLSSVLHGIIYKRCSVVAAQVLLREKSGV
jgi:hypothetical protein